MIDQELFLRFVVERHRVWEARQVGAPQPWTTDPILATRKFTNVFRILDPGTQYVMTDLLDPALSQRDQLARLFLYRHTGRVQAWQWLGLHSGYPTASTLEDAREGFRLYRGPGVFKGRSGKGNSPNGWMEYKRLVFTDAYLVFPQSQERGTDKMNSIIDLTARAFTPGSPDDVMPAFERATSQRDRFLALQAPKGVGDFMAMQILTDWGYAQDVDREDEFLMPGPGSVKGAKALDPDAKTMAVVKKVVEAVREHPDCPRLGYRRPSLMDIGSNLLCEWSKYVRFRGSASPAAAKPYKPAHPGEQPQPVLPSYYDEDLL